MPALQWRIELRNFRKYLASNLLIIGLLGVGLAATIVIFGFLKALVFDPLPFPNAAQIEMVGLVSKESAEDLESPDGKLVAQWQQAFQNKASPDSQPWFAIAAPATVNVGADVQAGRAPERVDGAFVVGSLWAQLGVQPKLGRDFSAADFQPGMPQVVIIGDSLWRSRYQSNPGIIGEVIRINGQLATVIAVMPENISFPQREMLWTQAQLAGAQADYGFNVFLRAEIEGQRSAHLAIMQNEFLEWQKSAPNGVEYLEVGYLPMNNWLVDPESRILAGVMFAAVCLLLFAVCMNAASVLLVRLFAEQSQNALRLALGSGWLPLAMSALVQSLLLAACGGGGADGLQKWMTDQRSAVRPKVVPIPEPKIFRPEGYAQGDMVAPFSKEKLAQALTREGVQAVANAALVAPELARRKQALEAFPLDSMALVGSMVRAGQTVALVKVNNLLYQVRPGDYLGQNFGRVTKINETEVALREIVQDAVGEWIERTASLQLQERSK